MEKELDVMRVCKTCGEEKPLAEGFYKHTMCSGYERECKACRIKRASKRKRQPPSQPAYIRVVEERKKLNKFISSDD